MQEIYKILIGIGVLILGFPLGNFLARITRDETKKWQIGFKSIILACLIGAVITLIIGNDAFFFSFLFFAIVLSRSLKR